ncbi:MAG: sugar transferase [Candidatus Omnitrophica bacterium]|nr:sugar transferase [Candidatus Omnitrophota bacterium]
MISGTLFILIRLVYVALDVISIFLSIFLACWLRKAAFPVNLHQLFFDTANPFHLVFVLWLVIVLFFNGLHRLYQTRREVVESHELWLVLRSVFFAAVTALAFVYSMKIVGFPRSAFLLIVSFTAVLFCLWRIGKRFFVEFLAANGYNNFNVVIIGAGKVGLMLAEELRRHPGFGLKVVGFLDDYKKTADLGGQHEVLGKLSDLKDVIRRRFVSKIFVTIHPHGEVLYEMIATAQEHHVGVRVVPHAFDKASGDIFKYNIGFIPILEYSETGYNRLQYGKRFFDFLISLMALAIFSPFFLAIAIAIKLDSRGAVFYFSRRYGRGGRVFNMWKFRSMVVDADEKLTELKHKNEVDGPIFKIRRDPRITKVGRFLRKYSVDELPQLVNVLLGDMSLVGPRPLPITQVEKEDLRQLKRLEVRPGITGLWQVRGRSDLPFHRLIKWDSWYVNNWSFMLDINILLETIPVVLKGKGAY